MKNPFGWAKSIVSVLAVLLMVYAILAFESGSYELRAYEQNNGKYTLNFCERGDYSRGVNVGEIDTSIDFYLKVVTVVRLPSN